MNEQERRELKDQIDSMQNTINTHNGIYKMLLRRFLGNVFEKNSIRPEIKLCCEYSSTSVPNSSELIYKTFYHITITDYTKQLYLKYNSKDDMIETNYIDRNDEYLQRVLRKSKMVCKFMSNPEIFIAREVLVKLGIALAGMNLPLLVILKIFKFYEDNHLMIDKNTKWEILKTIQTFKKNNENSCTEYNDLSIYIRHSLKIIN